MEKYIFYKGVAKKDLERSDYIPGTVTTSFKEALMWKERIESSKRKGAARNVRHGESVVIEITFYGDIKDHSYFQKAGVSEHERDNCWTSVIKDKAQINIPVNYRVLTKSELNELFTF